jgi:hypothetical protein
MIRGVVAVLSWLAAAVLPQNAAHGTDREGSSLAITAQPVDGNAVLIARPGQAFFKFSARPPMTVILQGEVPPLLAAQFGASSSAPFKPGLQLHGIPERPGLYCDLLRRRGLGLSAACLHDLDGDGRFDEGLRFEFNSGFSELLFFTPTGKIIGGGFDRKPVPLATPVGYVASVPAANVTGTLTLRWRNGSRQTSGPENAELWISTPANYTDTGGVSERFVAFPRARAPLDVELYGIRLRIHGFDEQGDMKVSVLSMKDGETVPLKFQGYTITMIG